MTDHFAALRQTRRPWLDADALRDTYHRLSATLHPDVPRTGDAAAFAAINAAYSLLRDPAARARHLLELEAPVFAAHAVPQREFGDLFMRQAAIHQRLATFLARRAAVGNPLARALLACDEAALRRDIGAAQPALETHYNRALADLRALDARWIAGDETRFGELAKLQRQLTFLGKWTAQLREALFDLGA